MWMKDTRATRISATVFHKHKDITNPSVTPEYHIMTTSGKLVDELKVRMATHLRKTSLHQLEQLGTILKQGWSHPENPARPPPIPNKHPSTFPSSGLTENSQRNPHPIPRYPAHSIFQPPACLDPQVGVHQKISNQGPNHIAQLISNSKTSQETSILYPDIQPITFSNHQPVYIANSGSIRKFPTRHPTTSPSLDPTQKLPRKPP